MIVGTGVDIVDVSRFRGLMERRPEFLSRVLTEREISRDGLLRSDESLAARFAAKEALAKALGGPAGLAWHDCEVLVDEAGRPRFELQATVLTAAHDVGAFAWHLSLSHDGGMAIAHVVLEG